MKAIRKIEVIIISIIFLSIYFGYKLIVSDYYNINNITKSDYNSIVDGLKIKNTITINTIKLDEEDYLTHNDMKIKNSFSDFDEFDLSNNKNEIIKYVLYDKDIMVASFWMGTADTYINMFNSKNDIDIYGEENKKFNSDERREFFQKNDITNDIDFFKFLTENKDIKNNIFTSVKKMKTNYYIQFLAATALPQLDSITLIKGSYKGYIFNTKSSLKEVSILKNRKRYILTFVKLDYFTDEYIKEILETLIID